jgi:hypothetical protein
LLITGQPQSQLGHWGKSATFSVTAKGGNLPLSYQWFVGSAPIFNATNAMLVLNNLQATNAGAYTVKVSDAVGNSVTSTPPAVLTMTSVFTTDATINIGDTAYDGQDIVVSGCTLTVNGPHSFNSLQVISSGILTHTAAASGQPNNQVNLTIAHDVLVDATSRIDVSVKGYNAAYPGPGVAPTIPNYYAGGAGYGGLGGSAYHGTTLGYGGTTYGSLTQPVDWGSAGGTGEGQAGTAGGGAMLLTVNGILTVNGAISANGISTSVFGYYGGAGSGGSVWLTAGTLQGTGTISANGGSTSIDDDGGGGGGGRIAIYYANAPGFNFASQVTTLGGGPFDAYNLNGSNGTVYLSSVIMAPAVLSATPNGGAARPLASHVDLLFNAAIDPATFTTADVTVTTPSGAIPAAQLTVTNIGGTWWRIGFPNQTANGHYQYQIGPHIANLFGQEMAASYSGGFTVNFTAAPTTTVSQTGGNLSLIWPSATGLSYQLQSATNLSAASWLNEGAPINGTGGLLTNSLPIGAEPSKFFRFLLLEN